jgi:nitroimidazol reductase NimA-like FMN-containing flavoprotein (pyridoxamine 5'-phosphate oxidase superfamily)
MAGQPKKPSAMPSSTKPRAKSAKPAGPQASRPSLPAEYGFPKGTKGLLPWSHVVDRMTQSRYYWIATVDPGGRPHATPVDGVWLDDRLFFGGSPKTRRNRNLAQNPATCVHLENGLDVVILQGDTELVLLTRAEIESLMEATKEKYGYSPPAEMYEKNGVQRFRPSVVFAWKDFAKDATRWRL